MSGEMGSSGVPEGWRTKSLEEISAISSGSTPSRSKSEYWNGEIPWVTTSEIKYNLITDTGQKITRQGFDAASLKMYQPGTILMAMYGQGVTRGRIARLDISATINQACCAITVKSDSDPDFIYSQLEYLYPHIRSLGHGGNQQNLNGETVKQIAVKMPPLAEQRKIAAILRTWDEAIDQQTRLLELKRECKRGLMQQLLTGRVRFREFEGLEWAQFPLQQIADVSMGSSPASSAYNGEEAGLPLLQGNTDIKNRRSKPKIWTTEITRECQVGDILVSVRAPVGTISLSLHHACIGRGIAAVTVKTQIAVQAYLYQHLIYLEPNWVRLSQGSTFEAINSKDLKDLLLTIPRSIKEQQKIATVLSAADAELDTLTAQLAALKSQKRGLMQRLLTGKTRVKLA